MQIELIINREDRVEAFRRAAGKGNIYKQVDESVYRCLQEEYDEANEAIVEYLNSPTDETRQNVAKELADLQYVLSQMALYLNIDLEEAFSRVHESNMTKVVDGKILYRDDGKILKPATYRKPDMSGI